MALDDHTRIGSVTKTFTGTAILQLVDQGRIRLSDPISEYVEGVPSGDVITLDLLGRMRSGLPDYSETDTFLDRVYTELPTGPDAFSITSRKLVDAAFAQPMEFAPGTDYKYCNTNTVLLGMVVEKVTGLSLADYLQQNIFDPLGLDATSYPPNGLMPLPYAQGYNKAPDGTVFDAALWNPSWGNAAGVIVSNAADMTTWAAALGKGTLLTAGHAGATHQRRHRGRTRDRLRLRDLHRAWLARPQRRYPRVCDGGGVSARTRRHVGGLRQLRYPGTAFGRPDRL